MADIDSLIDRHEMGQAYKTITAQMGPSPQLIAFVNYDKVTEDSLGLESFDIVSQHQAILAEIDNDNSLELAYESLVANVKDFLSRNGGLLFTAEEKDLQKLVGHTLVSDNSNSFVTMSYADYKLLEQEQERFIKLLDWFINHTPKEGFENEDAWVEFAKLTKSNKINPYTSEEMYKLKSSRFMNPSLDYKTSGWSAENFKEAVEKAFALKKEEKDSNLAFATLMNYVYTGEGAPKIKRSPKGIRAFNNLWDTTSALFKNVHLGENHLFAVLKDVSRHFKISK